LHHHKHSQQVVHLHRCPCMNHRALRIVDGAAANCDIGLIVMIVASEIQSRRMKDFFRVKETIHLEEVLDHCLASDMCLETSRASFPPSRTLFCCKPPNERSTRRTRRDNKGQFCRLIHVKALRPVAGAGDSPASRG
jgi:hypothetical protein